MARRLSSQSRKLEKRIPSAGEGYAVIVRIMIDAGGAPPVIQSRLVMAVHADEIAEVEKRNEATGQMQRLLLGDGPAQSDPIRCVSLYRDALGLTRANAEGGRRMYAPNFRPRS